MAGKPPSAQLQPERSIWAPDSFSPRAGITPLTPFCFGSAAEQLESSPGLLLHLYHIWHRIFCLLRKEFIWITGYQFHSRCFNCQNLSSAKQCPSLKQQPEDGYGVQPGFRMEDNHYSVPETFQKEKLVMASFCKRTDSKVFYFKLCLLGSIFVSIFPSVWIGKWMRINFATRVITMESKSDILKASVRGPVNRSRPAALSK